MSYEDMSETKIFLRCELCGQLVEQGQHYQWRIYPVEVGYPMYCCPTCWNANQGEAQARLESIEAARKLPTPALTPEEWLAIFGD